MPPGCGHEAAVGPVDWLGAGVSSCSRCWRLKGREDALPDLGTLQHLPFECIWSGNPSPVTLFSEIRVFRPPAMVPRVPLNTRVEVLSPETCERDLVWKRGVCRGWALIRHDCVLTEKRCLHLETQMREETARRHACCGTGRPGTGGGAPQAAEQWRAEGADREPARQPADKILASELGENRSHRL